MYPRESVLTPSADRDETRALFGQTMGLVALTAAMFALGSYLGRHQSSARLGVVHCSVHLPDGHQRRRTALGAARDRAPLRLRRADRARGLADDRLLRERRPVRALAGRRRDRALHRRLRLGGVCDAARSLAFARAFFWALVALIVFGVVLIFVQVPHGALIYSILGLVIFAGITMFDFQRLRRTKGLASAPMLAASIFLDVLNVFLFFLTIFGGGGRRQ